jgi:hypothetical protein
LAGTPGELVIVSKELALNPVTESHAATPAVPFGAYATPELTVAEPRVTIACAVTVNVADATLPRLSVTVTIWLPAAKLAVSGDLVTLNWNADVPCSVTIGVAGINGEIVVGVKPFPILTLAKDAPGPNPVTVAVTSVPTGPEVGDRVTVGVLSVKVVSALLP